jgi:hypothetical protein
VPPNVAYPTDSGLLAKAVPRIGVTVRRIRAAGGATRTRVRDRAWSAARAHAIGAKLRTRSAAGREQAQAAVQRVTGERADLASRAAAEADTSPPAGYSPGVASHGSRSPCQPAFTNPESHPCPEQTPRRISGLSAAQWLGTFSATPLQTASSVLRWAAGTTRPYERAPDAP